MIVLHEKSQLLAEKRRIEDFKKLYNNSFPDANEREDFDTILNRIETKSFDEDAKTFMVLSGHGGMVAELYPSADSILITYIAVDENNRQKGAGSKLLRKGLQRIREIISEHNPKPHHIAVFLEVNNPQRTKRDSFSPINRFEFFRKNEAKKIDIEYVQPSLDAGKERVRNLDLLTIPEKGTKLTNKQLYRFLNSFYRELGVTDPAADTDFIAMNLVEDDEFAKLRELAHFENHLHKFYHCSVAIHIPLNIEDKTKLSCPNFKSFEHDLMSYRYQNNDFIHSRVAELPAINTELTFPVEILYTSEGRNESIVDAKSRNIINCRVSANITSIRGQYSVASFVFQPAQKDFFTEYDIVKLSSIFGSKQEQTNLINEILIGKEKLSLFFHSSIVKLFKLKISRKEKKRAIKILELGFGELYKSISGTVVLNVDKKKDSTLTKFFDVFQELDLHRNESVKKAENVFSSKHNSYYKLMCAFLLGIFDFNRLNTEEIVDTLVPVNTSKDCAMFINRGCMLVLKRDDDIFPQIQDTIGINPYYILPFIVVTHNDFMMNSARNALSQKSKVWHRKYGKNILNARRFLLDMVEGVFEYPSENRIIEYVNKERHVPLLLAEINSQIKSAKELLELRKTRRLLFIEGIIGYFVLLFGIVQGSGYAIDNFFNNYFDFVSSNRNIIILALVLLATVLYFFKTIINFVQRNK